MDLLLSFLEALVELSNAMAVYILFGLLFAGILHELVPDTLVKEHLGSDNISSVIKATLFGIPLPVCSCGVIPLATSIKKSGASNGATLSFLISTPITGIDSILATFGMFGWAFTLYRLISSMIIAMISGILTNIFKAAPVTASRFSVAPSGFSATLPTVETSSCCSVSNQQKKKFSLKQAFRYGFITLLGDIAKPLFWGLLLGALITIMVPSNLALLLQEHTWVSYLIVVAIAVPMYVCATASLPIAAALILAGVSPGAAFVFLTAGPATNTVTIGVVKNMLGKRALAIYLGSIALGSILFGILLDTLFSWLKIDITELVHLHEEASYLDIASSILLWGFIIYFFVKAFMPKKAQCCSSSGSCNA